MDIKFGTDGWRARIGEEYTFDNLRRCAQGFATFVKENGRSEQGIVIGHDKRFQAEYFAAAAAEVLAANGIRVWLTDGATPTPAVSYSVVDKRAGGAISCCWWTAGPRTRTPTRRFRKRSSRCRSTA